MGKTRQSFLITACTSGSLFFYLFATFLSLRAHSFRKEKCIFSLQTQSLEFMSCDGRWIFLFSLLGIEYFNNVHIYMSMVRFQQFEMKEQINNSFRGKGYFLSFVDIVSGCL